MKRQQIILLASFAGGLILTIYLSWIFLFTPLKNQITNEKNVLESEKVKLEEAKSKAAQHDKFLAEAENVRRGLNFVSGRFESKFSYQEQTGLFSVLGKSEGIRNYVFTPKKAEVSKEFPGFNEIPVNFKFDANYHDMGTFINHAISQRRVLVPIDVKLSGKDATGRKPSLGAEINFKVYLLQNK